MLSNERKLRNRAAAQPARSNREEEGLRAGRLLQNRKRARSVRGLSLLAQHKSHMQALSPLDEQASTQHRNEHAAQRSARKQPHHTTADHQHRAKETQPGESSLGTRADRTQRQ